MLRRRRWWCGREVLVDGGFAANDLCGLLCKVRDHVM